MKRNIDNASKTILDIFDNTAVIHGKRLAAKDPVRERECLRSQACNRIMRKRAFRLK